MEDEVYRIPKKIKTEFRVLGLTIKGFLMLGAIFILYIAQFMVFPPHHLNSALPRIFIPLFLIAVFYMGLAIPQVTDMIDQVRYHKKHAAILHWESDHHVIAPFETKDQD